ncbi:MAG: hypothetical protein K9M54_08935 [Kiritimatiellales bacterium]|nr:hypothetical protein [Kiritimatiellales bacterium]
MKKNAKAGWIMVVIMGLASGAMAESKWFAEGTGGFWISPDMDGFQVRQGTAPTYVETIDGQASLVGNLKAGLEFDESGYVVDVAGLGGFYGNDAISGLLFGIDSSIRYKFGEQRGAFSIGPHAGFNAYTAPVWQGSLDEAVEFDPTVGGVLGVKATVGNDSIRFVFTLDYVAAEFDVSNDKGSSPNDTLDMSGFVVQVGIQF